MKSYSKIKLILILAFLLIFTSCSGNYSFEKNQLNDSSVYSGKVSVNHDKVVPEKVYYTDNKLDLSQFPQKIGNYVLDWNKSITINSVKEYGFNLEFSLRYKNLNNNSKYIAVELLNLDKSFEKSIFIPNLKKNYDKKITEYGTILKPKREYSNEVFYWSTKKNYFNFIILDSSSDKRSEIHNLFFKTFVKEFPIDSKILENVDFKTKNDNVNIGNLLPNKIDLSNSLRGSPIDSAFDQNGKFNLVFSYIGARQGIIYLDGNSKIVSNNGICSPTKVKNLDTTQNGNNVSFLNGQTGLIIYNCDINIQNSRFIDGNVSITLINPRTGLNIKSFGNIRFKQEQNNNNNNLKVNLENSIYGINNELNLDFTYIGPRVKTIGFDSSSQITTNNGICTPIEIKNIDTNQKGNEINFLNGQGINFKFICDKNVVNQNFIDVNTNLIIIDPKSKIQSKKSFNFRIYKSYQFSDNNTNSNLSSSQISVEMLDGNTLYIKNSANSILINSIKILSNTHSVCSEISNINLNANNVQKIDLTNCNLTKNQAYDVVILTQNGVYSRTILSSRDSQISNVDLGILIGNNSNNNNNNNNNNNSQISCIDSDGANYANKGITSGYGNLNSIYANQIITNTDTCIGNQLEEFTCNSNNRVFWQTAQCSFWTGNSNSYCSDGACIINTTNSKKHFFDMSVVNVTLTTIANGNVGVEQTICNNGDLSLNDIKLQNPNLGAYNVEEFSNGIGLNYGFALTNSNSHQYLKNGACFTDLFQVAGNDANLLKSGSTINFKIDTLNNYANYDINLANNEFVINQVPNPVLTNKLTCRDSDGVNKNILGTVLGNVGSSQITFSKDLCVSSNILNENICSNNNPSVQSISCNSFCDNGRCTTSLNSNYNLYAYSIIVDNSLQNNLIINNNDKISLKAYFKINGKPYYFNSTNYYKLKGTFYLDGMELGTIYKNITGNTQYAQMNLDWFATTGNHTISFKVVDFADSRTGTENKILINNILVN